MKSNFRKILGVSMTVAMLASMLVTAVPVAANVSAVTVSVDPTTISLGGNYTVTFGMVGSLANSNSTGNITISFPSDTATTNASLLGNVTVQSTAGFGTAVVETTISAGNATVSGRTVTIRLGDLASNVGEGATVRVKFRNGSITNPSTTGSYSLNVSTSNETTAIASSLYTITAPVISALGGIVTGKNSAGLTLVQTLGGDINTAINTAGVKTIEVSAGTYNVTVTANVVGQTIVGTGAAGTVILAPDTVGALAMSITAVNVTIENFVVNAENANGISVTANNSNIKNVTFNRGVNQLSAAVVASNNRTTVTDCIFNVVGNVTSGIATTSRITTNSTFNVDDGGTAIIATNGGALTLNANTKINGSAGAGAGVLITGNHTSTITGAIFSNLGNNAVWSSGIVNSPGTNATGTTVTIKDSTFSGSGNSSTTEGVITNILGDLILTNNTINGNNAAAYGLQVTGGNVTARFNTISNTLNVRRSAGTANASNNWWGAATGPASTTISGTVTTTPYLTGITSSPLLAFAVTSNLTIAGVVDVTTSNGTIGAVGLAKYANNPQAIAPLGTPVAYYDVYIATPADGSTITIKFFGGVNENSKIYYGGGLTGAWTLAGTQGVNVPGGYAYIQVNNLSSPGFSDFGGTPFVLTNIVPPPAVPVLTGPISGATGVPTNTGFSWAPVAGATSYDFQISTSPTFATLVVPAATTAGTVYGGVALAANTTYFWRVRSVTGTLVSAYATSTFTTAGPAVAAVAPNITIAAPPPAQITVTAPTVNVAAPPPAVVNVAPPTVNVATPPAPVVNVSIPPAAPLVPAYLLWTIILIGAVLVIALIVLIVRTRRVA